MVQHLHGHVNTLWVSMSAAVSDCGGCGTDRASSEKQHPSPLLTDARERKRTAVNACERLDSNLNTRTNQQKSSACVSASARDRVCSSLSRTLREKDRANTAALPRGAAVKPGLKDGTTKGRGSKQGRKVKDKPSWVCPGCRWNKQKINTAVFVFDASETSKTALHTVSCSQGNRRIVQIKTCVYSNFFPIPGETSFLWEAEPQVIRVSPLLPWFFPMWPFSQSKAAWLCGIKSWPHCELSAPGSRRTKPDLEHLTPPCERSSKERILPAAAKSTQPLLFY